MIKVKNRLAAILFVFTLGKTKAIKKPCAIAGNKIKSVQVKVILGE